jgi:MFS family permease
VVNHLHLTPAMFGLIATINTLLIVAVEIPLNHATSAWSHRRTMVLGALCTALGFGLIGLATGFPMLAATTVIWTVGEMITSPGISAYVADIAPPARRGEYMGLFTMTWSVSFIVAPWAGTQLLAHVGPRLVWPVLAGLGVLSALGYTRLPGRAHEPAPDAA